MNCTKIGGQCPHPVTVDENIIFVMMPFANFDNVYDSIQLSVQSIRKKRFKCIRADDEYTNISIWCESICKNIRKSKYCIADVTGKNPNVFYELGFAHAIGNSKIIIISQSIKYAPFDIKDLGIIEYSLENLKNLREQLSNAITTLENKNSIVGYKNKTSNEIIFDLKQQLYNEEERVIKFKKLLADSEESEFKLKEQINNIVSIQNNPEEEAKSKIANFEGKIATLNSIIKNSEKEKDTTITNLKNIIEQKEDELNEIQNKFSSFQTTNNGSALSVSLLDVATKNMEADDWTKKGIDFYDKGNIIAAFECLNNSISLNPDNAYAYYRRSDIYIYHIGDQNKAIEDINYAIQLDPARKAILLNSRGNAFGFLELYKKAEKDYLDSLEIDPSEGTNLNLAEFYIITNRFKKAQERLDIRKNGLKTLPQQSINLYLQFILRLINLENTDSIKTDLISLLKYDFEITWSFYKIDRWLNRKPVNEEKINKIILITSLLRKKKHGKG